MSSGLLTRGPMRRRNCLNLILRSPRSGRLEEIATNSESVGYPSRRPLRAFLKDEGWAC